MRHAISCDARSAEPDMPVLLEYLPGPSAATRQRPFPVILCTDHSWAQGRFAGRFFLLLVLSMRACFSVPRVVRMQERQRVTVCGWAVEGLG